MGRASAGTLKQKHEVSEVEVKKEEQEVVKMQRGGGLRRAVLARYLIAHGPRDAWHCLRRVGTYITSGSLGAKNV